VITIAIRLRYDYDPTTVRRIARAYFQFDASKKWTCQFFVVVVSQSNRNCDIGLTRQDQRQIRTNQIWTNSAPFDTVSISKPSYRYHKHHWGARRWWSGVYLHTEHECEEVSANKSVRVDLWSLSCAVYSHTKRAPKMGLQKMSTLFCNLCAHSKQSFITIRCYMTHGHGHNLCLKLKS